MDPTWILRLEDPAVLIAALATYFALDGSLLLLVALVLAPDLSMLGYCPVVRGPTSWSSDSCANTDTCIVRWYQ